MRDLAGAKEQQRITELLWTQYQYISLGYLWAEDISIASQPQWLIIHVPYRCSGKKRLHGSLTHLRKLSLVLRFRSAWKKVKKKVPRRSMPSRHQTLMYSSYGFLLIKWLLVCDFNWAAWKVNCSPSPILYQWSMEAQGEPAVTGWCKSSAALVLENSL